MTSRLRVLLAVAACAAPVVTGGAGAAPAAAPACDFLVTSPTVARDRTVFCGRVHDAALWSSTDLGRTWTRGALNGLPVSDTRRLSEIVPSRTYADDGVLWVRTLDGLYVSTDRAATVSVADPLGGGLSHVPALASLGTAPSLPGLPARPVLAQALQRPQPHLLQPPLRATAPGAPGPLDGFLAGPLGDGRYANTVLGVGRELFPDAQGRVSFRRVLYACDAALTCPTALAKLPDREDVHHVALAPDFARSGVVTFRTKPERGPWRVWISRDGGATVTPLASAHAVVDGIVRRGGRVTGLRVATDPSNARRMYLRVGLAWDAAALPIAQTFRSDDAGRSWRRVAYFHMPGKPWSRSPAGYGPGPSRDFGAGGLGEESMVVLSDGRVLAVGYDGERNRLYCSTDAGRTWQATCRR